MCLARPAEAKDQIDTLRPMFTRVCFPSIANILTDIVATVGGLRQIQVTEFAEARGRELELFKKTISEVRGTQRAFQTLPRHLRRRAMSHNIHRIPARLRDRAQHEVS